ncbi:FAD-binding oxidoreductase [Streptomyces sp. NPDC050355]|uniref:FAD-binding oxidoreductase n=1 Tax=Streptomyces sp. NPDC050355 TaxID=3365609 RepID=UPI0037941F4B
MDPQLWWYLARVGGLMSWWLLSATVLWGLLLSTRVLGPRMPLGRLLDLHRFLSGLALTFIAVHLLALVADTWVDIGLVQLLFPFTSTYRPVAVAWGVIALYLLVAIEVTSLLKRRIPHRWWRYVHGSTFAVFVLTTVHALTAGTDTTAVRWTALTLAAGVTFLALYRLLAERRPGEPSVATVSAAPRRHPRFHALTITDVRRETPEAVSLAFAVPTELAPAYHFQPGQHVSLRHTIDGRQVRRPYSISSAATASELRIAVKALPGGLMSTHLTTHIRTGDRIEVAPPAGRFGTAADPARSRHLLAIAAGSGITPIHSILATVLADEPNSRCTLLYGSRDHTSIIFRADLERLVRQYPGRLRVHHLLTRERPDNPLLHGRISPEKLHRLTNAGLLDLTDIDEAFLCGPEAMVRDLANALTARGMDHATVHQETFTSSPTARPSAPQQGSRDCVVTVILDGAVTEVSAHRNEPILNAALRAGIQVPYACRSGDCFTCEARLLAGQVTHREATPVPPGTPERVLSCQSRPAADRIVLDFDRA